jgi:hypothetical protein
MCPADQGLAIELSLDQRNVLVRADGLKGLDLTTLGTDQQNLLPVDLE